MKNEIHIKAGVQRTGHIGKRALVHFLDLLDLRAFFLKFGFQAVDDIFNGVFLALRVENDQTLRNDSS